MTYQKFGEAKRQQLIVHDINVRRWALAFAKEVGCLQLKASPSWILKFKKANKIVSRKITKFISTADVAVTT